jgi:plasmid stabilization system protein ParE
MIVPATPKPRQIDYQAKENAEKALSRAERLAAQVRSLGIEPEAGNGNGKSDP